MRVIAGLNPDDSHALQVHPLVPVSSGVRYFAVDGLRIRGHDVCVAYDRDGDRYGRGKGLFVIVDGHVEARGALGDRLTVLL